jgi:hypothetical protein
MKKDDKSEECNLPSTTWGALPTAIPMGMAFGMAMQNGLVTIPETIRLQFVFGRYVA